MKKIGICLVPQNLDVGRIQTQIVREEDILQWPQCLKRANRR